MSVMELSRSTQDFLKVVWAANEWSDAPVTPTYVAGKLRLKLSTVSGTFSRLVNEGLVERSGSGAIVLTDTGRDHALQMIRRHRLLETFLSVNLDFPLELLHDEAEHLEHVVSDYFIERIDALLGHPTRDPHGDPIPNRDGVLEDTGAHSLTEAEAGRHVVERIDDSDPELVSFFSQLGLVLGRTVEVSEGSRFSDTVNVVTQDGRSASLGRRAAEAVWVSPAPTD
ncbi:metal-dependent transcriptional regulator [Arachnia propionica]|uniref:Manganese transport regulator n=2 Tax=Arachnia propionica TaxID=1750 RepID=A0A3P1WSR4_9ACTN|nr:metal-dependent transcriptional regulator [Arachnia propionica]